MDYYVATKNLTNMILESIMGVQDSDTKTRLMDGLNDVRSKLFNLLFDLKNANVSEENIMPDAVIIATYNLDINKVVLSNESIDEYCKTTGVDPFDVYAFAHRMLGCLFNIDGKYVSSEVTFNNVNIGKFMVRRFTLKLI